MCWQEFAAVSGTVLAILGLFFTVQRYNTACRNRIYQRLDDVKTAFEDRLERDYARRDICVLTHQQIEKKLKDIETQTTLIPHISAQLSVLIDGQKNIEPMSSHR